MTETECVQAKVEAINVRVNVEAMSVRVNAGATTESAQDNVDATTEGVMDGWYASGTPSALLWTQISPPAIGSSCRSSRCVHPRCDPTA